LAVALGLVACGSAETSPSEHDEDLRSPNTNTHPTPADDPRQAAREASIFANLDFEELDEAGAPTGWRCYCGNAEAKCQVDQSAAHGGHALVLPSGCMATQTVMKFDPTKGVRFDYRAYGGHEYAGDVKLYATRASGPPEHVQAAGELPDSTSFLPVTSEGNLRTEGATSLMLTITNSNGAFESELGTGKKGKDLHVDDIVVVQDVPNPAAQVGSLLVARHVDQIGLTAGAAAATVFTPLPIDYASQVPLYLELTVDPASAVERIEYVTEAEHDWGAIIHFAAGASAANLRLEWRSVALVRFVPQAELPSVYTKLGDPAAWTQPSAIAESNYAPLVSLASGLVSASAPPADKMAAILGWTSKHLGGGTGVMAGLDAKTVFDSHVTSCTGYANTAMAMGRALGVPARHVTNILVGMSQDMHSINEFWLGESLGWRRVEPQSAGSFVLDDYGFIMRLVLPADEVGSTMGFPGVPLNEFTEYRQQQDRFTTPATFKGVFTDCSTCGNHADRQAPLRGAGTDLDTLFESARAKWQTDRAAYAAGGVSATRLTARRKFVDARSIEDVRQILSELP
jgi:hypothetical protein